MVPAPGPQLESRRRNGAQGGAGAGLGQGRAEECHPSAPPGIAPSKYASVGRHDRGWMTVLDVPAVKGES